MNKRARPSPITDLIGVVALTGAAAALVGVVWTPSLLPEALLFSAFHWCLAIGLGSLLGGRIVEIARVIAATPDPKALRSRRQADTTALAAAEHGNNVTDGKFRRAA